MPEQLFQINVLQQNKTCLASEELHEVICHFDTLISPVINAIIFIYVHYYEITLYSTSFLAVTLQFLNKILCCA